MRKRRETPLEFALVPNLFDTQAEMAIVDRQAKTPPQRARLREALAYIAGLFDGEGAVTIGTNRSGYFLRVKISMTTSVAMELCRRVFGGRIWPRPPRKETDSPTYGWQLDGRKAHRFLQATYPYLLVKRADAEIGFRFMALYQGSGPRHGSRLSEGFLQNATELKKELAALHPKRAKLPGRPRKRPLPNQLTLA